ncbi:MAG: CotH kinase family protein [Eubacteriales bacterium]
MTSIFKTLIILILCLFALSACSGDIPVDNAETAATDTAAVAGARQYLPAETQNSFEKYLSQKDSVYIIYAVNSVSAGLVEGKAIQDITAGSVTSAVTATAKLGYKFVQWSDGLTEARRSGDTSGSTEIITAIFDYDLLEMPVICISTETGRDVESRTDYINAEIKFINCDAKYETDVLGIQIRGRGNNTWSYEKKSYKIKLTEKENLLGIGSGKAKIWVLMANMCDQSLLRNYAAFAFSKSLSGIAFAPASQPVDVYLNGEYRGVYLLAEEVQINKNRLDIDDSADDTDIGYLVKLSYYADDETIFNLAGRQYHIVSDLSENGSLYTAQRDYIIDYMNECWEAVKSGDRDTIESLVDIDSYVDTYIAEEVLKNLDFGFDSFYLHKDKGGKLNFGPIWDFDLSLGNANETCEFYTDFYAAVDVGNGLSNPWYYTIMKQKWFRELVAARWDELADQLNAIPETVLEAGQKYNKAFSRNFVKWPIFGQVMNRETPFITALKTYDEHVQYLAGWAENRIKWLDENIHADSFLGSSRTEKIAYGNGTTTLIPENYESLNAYIIKDSISGTEGFACETAENAFDGTSSTKYCFGSAGESVLYFAASEPVTVKATMFMTANDTAENPNRNPDSWILYGSNDGKNGTWTVVASEPDGDALMGTANFTYYGMKTSNTESRQYYKLVITDYEIVQFAEFEIWGNKG